MPTSPVLGIDFGTSQSSMAWYNPKTGQAELIRNAEGQEKTPSVVYFGDSDAWVGTAAEPMLKDPEQCKRLVLSVKRELARAIKFALPGRRVSPVEVVAAILQKLKHDAEEGHFHEPVHRAVLTHPAAFD